MPKENLMEKIISLCKRRGFIFPSSEIYGGIANGWDYGPLGVELKNNIKLAWWERFVHRRDDMVGIDAALIMNPKVWEASGHLKHFSDPLVECKNCHERYRLDDLFDENFKEAGGWQKILDIINEEHPDLRSRKIGEFGKIVGIFRDIDKKKFPKNFLISDGSVYTPDYLISELIDKKIKCRKCLKNKWTTARQFNLMLKTFLGPVQDESAVVYFRPETAQAMFVNFKQVLQTTRRRIPFGIAQMGKAFRNEITPGNFIFRTREFEQMEIEYFVHPKEWKKYFEMWLKEMKEWLKFLGVKESELVYHEIPDGERAHYSERTIDIEYTYPFGTKELYGLAYRTDFDLQNHMKASGQNLQYEDPVTKEKLVPHVIEPTWGVDRTVLVTLLSAYDEEKANKDTRVVLRLPRKLVPYQVAVFPLLANKPQLVELAQKIAQNLREHFVVAWDDRGNIGKRYFSQDEIGTPYCVTVDFDSLEDKAVTVRDRDTMKQERVKIQELINYLNTRFLR